MRAMIDPRTSDDVLDGLVAGRAVGRGEVAVTSSSRFDGLARHRGSGAFDGGDRAWIGQWIPGRPAWLGWTVPSVQTVTRLVLTPPGSVCAGPRACASPSTVARDRRSALARSAW